MISLKGVRVARVGDIPAGHLVAYGPNTSSQFIFALRASDPQGDSGLLCFHADAKRPPSFVYGNSHCLDLGSSATPIWAPDLGMVAWFQGGIEPAPAVLSGDALLVAGTFGGGFNQPSYWDLLSGVPVPQSKLLDGAPVVVRRLELAIKGADGQLQPLISLG